MKRLSMYFRVPLILKFRPTVEVEEFCQSCPEAAHPHTAYVNNLYVYPLSLNYSNQKVFSKVNLDSKCKCKMLMFC